MSKKKTPAAFPPPWELTPDSSRTPRPSQSHLLLSPDMPVCFYFSNILSSFSLLGQYFLFSAKNHITTANFHPTFMPHPACYFPVEEGLL